MSDDQYYNVPAQPVEITTEIKRSRFIARIEHCPNEAAGFEIILGAGGLVRAYSNSCQAAVDQLTSRLVMPMLNIKIQFPFAYESSIRHYLDSQQVMISNVTYSDQVLLELSVEKNKLGSVLSHTNNLCKGDMIQLTSN